MLFRILLIFDLLFVLVLLYFFVDGLKYAGSVTSQGFWIPILGMPIVALVGALMLKSNGKTNVATAVLGALAIPPLFFMLFFGAILILEPSWR